VAVSQRRVLAVDGDDRAAGLLADRLAPHAAAAKRLLGEDFGEFVTCDRYAGYHCVDVLQQQLCWSHLVCQLTSLSEQTAPPGKLASDLLKLAAGLFACHRERATPRYSLTYGSIFVRA
jgi:Transposase IS66 family